MEALTFIFRVGILVIIPICFGIVGYQSFSKPVPTGCVMTYSSRIYIPISLPSPKYRLYFYLGGRKIDLKKLNGVPVLFIHGNGGSFEQVRSLGAVSDEAYQGGPLEWSQYTSMLDWFTVDLEEEYSAMDASILQQQTKFVVDAIHKVLDLYKESYNARANKRASTSESLPKTVILVGHSMGGFVARAAVVHPHLRKFAVETVLTLSTPHQSPPVALQPSLSHYYAQVNQEWRKGYEMQTSQAGQYLSDPLLSHIVVVSISGGYNDYQMRTKLESLDGIVPPTHGFMISSTGMKNVWRSIDHQAIVWCNQLVMQVSHTLLSLVDTKTGQPFRDVGQRLGIFMKMLDSGISKNMFEQLQLLHKSSHFPNQNGKVNGFEVPGISGCPSSGQWGEDGLERDLDIQTSTINVSAMDGRRRWLDIQKLGQDGKSHFVFVTNLSPCSGVQLHLSRQKRTSASEFSLNKGVMEVTSKRVQIPSGSATGQIEPGNQTEQGPKYTIFLLGPEDMHGFQFLTISVGPHPTISGRHPTATSMGVGQFFNPRDAEQIISFYQLIHSLYSVKARTLKEDHPLALSLTFYVSLGLLPVSLSLATTGCAIKRSTFPIEESGDDEASRLCTRHCFPPVALAWDVISGLHVFSNLSSETITVDSSPALWTSSQDSDQTTVLLLVDPHCSYRSSVRLSLTAAAFRFLISYYSQIAGLCPVVVFFALMRQAYGRELDQPIPSMLSAVDSNLRMPRTFCFLATLPILFAVLISFLSSQSRPPIISFSIVLIVCYISANGVIVVLILLSKLLFYVTCTVHVLVKKVLVALSQLLFYVASKLQPFVNNWWQACEWIFSSYFLGRVVNVFSSFASFTIKVVRILMVYRLLITSFVAVALVCLVHPALGLFVLLLSHILRCHSTLASYLESEYVSERGSPESTRSSQLEIFHLQHGLLILHLLAALMFVPSLVAWLTGTGHIFPWFWDSVLCIGVLLHGFCDLKPKSTIYLFPIPGIQSWAFRLSSAYFLAGFFSCISALALAPSRVFYTMAAIGIVFLTALGEHAFFL